IFIQVNAEKFQSLRQMDPNLKIEHFKIENIADMPVAVSRIGEIAKRHDLAEKVNQQFSAQLAAVRQRTAGMDRPRVLFVMGYEHPATGGNDTFIGQMIETAGGINVAGSLKGWQNLNLETILQFKPDVIVCQVDENYEKPDGAKNYWLQMKDIPACKSGRVFVVTDRYWSIPMLRTPEYIVKLADMIHNNSAK
ncbi:MAG: hypothetical protein EHM48_09845, partial [Planctomycetaceae bacterium]